MKLVTPAKGTIELSKEKDPELFHLARCGLGGLGVVAEVTLQCVERHELVEHTYVSNLQDIKKNHKLSVANFRYLCLYIMPSTMKKLCSVYKFASGQITRCIKLMQVLLVLFTL